METKQLSPTRARQRRYEQENRDKERERKRKWRDRHYKAESPLKSVYHRKTRAEIYAILEAQGARCAICKSTTHGGRGWHGDHDHKTGLFRGVLCSSCNLALGGFKDKINVLYEAIRYLERHADLKKLL